MTKEEQQAYFAKREQELLDKCRIQSEEQFLAACGEAGISADWYAFSCDRSRPVSMDADTVYYGKSGKTIVSYPFQRWDIAFRELLRFQEEHAWEAAGAPYRITSVEWKSDAGIVSALGNTMTIREYRFSEQPEQEMLDNGWRYDRYDRYMGYSVYHKTVSAGSVMGNAFLVFEFSKRTDRRDRETFGFAEGRYLRGSYRYAVPQDLQGRIRAERDFPVRLSEALCRTLTERLAKHLIEDEYEDLRALMTDEQHALRGAFDRSLPERAQKEAFAQALRRAEAGHPAVDPYEDRFVKYSF